MRRVIKQQQQQQQFVTQRHRRPGPVPTPLRNRHLIGMKQSRQLAIKQEAKRRKAGSAGLTTMMFVVMGLMMFH